MIKETSYNKQKRLLKESEEKVRLLKSELKKVVRGDFELTTQYLTLFRMEEQAEKQMWSGETSYGKK